jgi:multiple sugar transport system substrate-binding protein
MNQVYYFQTLLYQLGGSYLNEDLTAPAFNSEEGVKAMQFVADLILKEQVVPPPGGGFTDGFVSEKYAMAFDGPWRFGNWVNELGLDVETVIHPKNPDTGRQDTIVYGNTLQVMKTNPEEQSAAATFLMWFLGKEMNARWSIETGYLPIRVDSAQTEEYQKFLAGPGSVMQSFLEGFDHGHFREGSVVLPKYSEINTIFNDECWDRVALGERTVEEGLEAAEKMIMADSTLFERIDL